MMLKFIKVCTLTFGLLSPDIAHASAHGITFCGESIPVDQEFVAGKLMNVIRKQIQPGSLSYLRYQSKRYFPFITAWLKHYHIPDDFKYIPIVECGFRNNLSSKAGAAGFWQLMVATAIEQKLLVSSSFDQRMDPYSSTPAACRVIKQHYDAIKKGLGRPSWVLTAAAYNFGPANILNAVKRQGSDYFRMKLNGETAEYVYRLIAIKELFEHPELYMNGFGTNIFSQDNITPNTTDTGFVALSRERRGALLGDFDKEAGDAEIKIGKTDKSYELKTRAHLVAAKIVSPQKQFHDGDMLRFELLSNLWIADISQRKGAIIKGKGWLIDGRVYVDFGYGHQIMLQDALFKQGISIEDAEREGAYTVLKTEEPVY